MLPKMVLTANDYVMKQKAKESPRLLLERSLFLAHCLKHHEFKAREFQGGYGAQWS